jgi:hypothetical protein
MENKTPKTGPADFVHHLELYPRPKISAFPVRSANCRSDQEKFLNRCALVSGDHTSKLGFGGCKQLQAMKCCFVVYLSFRFVPSHGSVPQTDHAGSPLWPATEARARTSHLLVVLRQGRVVAATSNPRHPRIYDWVYDQYLDQVGGKAAATAIGHPDGGSCTSTPRLSAKQFQSQDDPQRCVFCAE